ncbi:MAG TPA: HD domain-containing protein [Candidatus Gastranaerophilales bacterium]|nr:HD domain-containing protein [Candidatus Gastranaerophilales bacterium]
MERILPLELVGTEKLDYDLLDEKGDLIFPKGEFLTASVLIKLSYLKLYKHEFVSIEMPDIKIGLSEQKSIESLIKQSAGSELLIDTRNILQKAYDNVPVKLEECVKSTKIIIDEVSAAFKNIYCIDQLRIYDEYTYSHNINVASLSTAVGMMLNLDEKEIKELALGAFLHDIGKMKIPKEVLNKPDKLDNKEREIMRRHTSAGYRYIKENFEIADRIARVALDHHEKFAGKGYPNGINGVLINKYAQIVNIVDIYDALASDRVYKKGIPRAKVLEIMTNELKNDFNRNFFEKFLILANPDYEPEEAPES